ncbi:regulatory protein [Comamonas thiooxydans]|uniref:Regulatory protein n=1 Tax=Comamonas thiooxydans TaxID=363952 RepID=A0A0E3CET1_9BURK|nr:regulatory protein [Comamonas thiooxydans]KGH20462.1 regulatory protein [Comamonas thiooxydans]
MPRPVFVIRYEQKDITNDLTPYVRAVTYTDYLSGQSDTLEVELEDVDGRWIDTWYPGKGDTLSADIGYDNAPLLPCGSFEIDEIEFSFPPSVVRIKALSTGVKASVRTPNGKPYENTTLAAIAQRVAKRNRLTLIGKIREIRIDRVTQFMETDVAFLTRLAREFGYAFKITGSKLVFSELAELRRTGPAVVLTLQDLSQLNLRDKIKEIYKEEKQRYFNPKTKKLEVYGVKDGQMQVVGQSTAKGKDGKDSGQQVSADTHKMSARAGSKATAQVKAQAALDASNLQQTAGSMTAPGNTKLVAGNTVDLQRCGKLDGKYLVESARHRMERSSGYTTELEIKRVALPVKLGGTGPGTASSKKSGKKLDVYGVQADGTVGVVGSSQAASKKK